MDNLRIMPKIGSVNLDSGYIPVPRPFGSLALDLCPARPVVLVGVAVVAVGSRHLVLLLLHVSQDLTEPHTKNRDGTHTHNILPPNCGVF